MMVLLAAFELHKAWQTCVHYFLSRYSPLLRGSLITLISFLIILTTVRIYPYNLVYFTPLISGTSGAQKAGFDLEYLGVTMQQLNPALQKVTQPGDILLFGGCNAVARDMELDGWPSIPQNRVVIDFKLLYQEPYASKLRQIVASTPRQAYAILSSRYGDLGEAARLILAEIPPIAQVTYQNERLFSLHRLPDEWISNLPERLAPPIPAKQPPTSPP
jgi:hypothetical protein